MKRYINQKTGAIIDSPCVISGGDWKLETKEAKETKEQKTEKKTGKTKK